MENINNYENIAFFAKKLHAESLRIFAGQNLLLNIPTSGNKTESRKSG